MTTCLVINACHGGFRLSDAAKDLYMKRAGREPPSTYSINRADPVLVDVVRTLGSKAASGRHSKLRIIKIPENVEYCLDDYDGKEWVAEKHRQWGRFAEESDDSDLDDSAPSNIERFDEPD